MKARTRSSYAAALNSQSASLALLAANPFPIFSVGQPIAKADVIQSEGHSMKTGLALLRK